jgi:Ser/Thr protein kinase RdoA (MazF antagonist)
VLDVAVALAYTMIESLNNAGMNAVHVSGHVLRGYQSAYPLSSLEMDMLLEAAKTRICHSLVMGAYNYKYVNPGYDYLIYGTENGWKVLDDLRNIPARDVVKSWKRSCLNQ